MLLTYLDESYSRDMYFVAALVCPDREAISLTTALDSVVSEASSAYGLPPETELHGHELLQAKGNWAPLARNHQARIDVYEKAFQVIGKHDIRIIICGVNSRRLRERYTSEDDPHGVVLANLLKKLDEFAARIDDYALVIADEVPGQGQYRVDFSRYKSHGIWGARARLLTRIVDTLHFAPSSESRLVQAADLIAFMYHRIESGVDADIRAKQANRSIWKHLDLKIHHVDYWNP